MVELFDIVVLGVASDIAVVVPLSELDPEIGISEVRPTNKA